MKKRGFEVHSAYFGDQSDPDLIAHPQPQGVLLRGLWPRLWNSDSIWRTRLRSLLNEVKPDIVIAQQTVSIPTISVCKEFGIPVILFIRNLDDFCLGGFWTGQAKKCDYRCIGCKDAGPRIWQFPFFIMYHSRVLRLIRSADAIIANSQNVQRILRDLLGMESLVILPQVEAPCKDATEMRDKILFISPVQHKGSEIALKIAEHMPNESFLFVGDAKQSTIERMQRLANVQHIHWTRDVGSIYNSSRLLIVPSISSESFGRVCLEAMSLGIPCIVSRSGSLPETVGASGDVVMDSLNHESWIATIQRYSDGVYYETKSNLSLSRYQEYMENLGIDNLLLTIERLLANRR
ncbi:MAG: glycosyltransferase family 4 protein [Candidatus Thermoplasmatota archaeon]|nr:glycosyltransferase family 4 protein [Candidatus Thermoplasmatota archaeon]